MTVDTTMLPTWALVDFGDGVRVAGWVEQAEIGGQPFITIAPHEHESIKINATQVTAIWPCEESYAAAVARRQWAPPTMSSSTGGR